VYSQDVCPVPANHTMIRGVCRGGMSSYRFVCISMDSPPRPFSPNEPRSVEGYIRPAAGGIGREISTDRSWEPRFRRRRMKKTAATTASAMKITATPTPIPAAAPEDSPPPPPPLSSFSSFSPSSPVSSDEDVVDAPVSSVVDGSVVDGSEVEVAVLDSVGVVDS
jgi:hypothetical protein